MASSQSSLLLCLNSLHHLISIISVKLNSSNYPIWKAQILPLIQSLGVEGHLKSAPPVEVILNDKDETVPNPAFTSWKYRDLLLKSWMTGTLSEEALYYVVGCNTARDI